MLNVFNSCTKHFLFFISFWSSVAMFEGLQFPIPNWLLKTSLHWLSSCLMFVNYAAGNHSAHWVANLPSSSLSESVREVCNSNGHEKETKLIIQSNIHKDAAFSKSCCFLTRCFSRLGKQWCYPTGFGVVCFVWGAGRGGLRTGNWSSLLVILTFLQGGQFAVAYFYFIIWMNSV